MGGKGGSDDQTVVQRTEIPGWLEGRLQTAAGRAEDLFQSGQPPFFPGPTVVPFSPETQAGLGYTSRVAAGGGPEVARTGSDYLQSLLGGSFVGAPGADLAAGGQALTSAARGEGYDLGPGAAQMERTAAGDYLFGGPGFSAALDAATRDILPRVQSAFGMAGRHRSGLAQEALGQAVADQFAGMYGQERARQEAAASGLAGLSAQERARQLGAAGALTDISGRGEAMRAGAAGLVPGFTDLAYDPGRRLLGTGAIQEAKVGEMLADEAARYGHQVYGPQTTLDQLISRLQGVGPFAGGTTSTTQPLYGSPLAGALGGGLAGLGVAGALAPTLPFFGGPVGMGIAGLLGAGAGAFGR